MKYWWVNQNQTYRHEVRGGFLWSPKQSRNGRPNPFYDTMMEVRAGDLIFSYCDTQIKAIGVAQAAAITGHKPDFGIAGANWNDDGWYVRAEFQELEHPIRPKDIIEDLRPYLGQKYGPLRSDGVGKQAYLFEVSEPFAQLLLEKLGTSSTALISRLSLLDAEGDEDEVQRAIEGRTDIGDTQKTQLILARRGQGIFKSNVRLNENKCRVTGIGDERFLIASHIKPWRLSGDREKLDGCNGLLLSPHVDRLFDRGFITFEDDGALLLSSALSSEVIDGWHLNGVGKVGRFNSKQADYLAFHRANIFKQ